MVWFSLPLYLVPYTLCHLSYHHSRSASHPLSSINILPLPPSPLTYPHHTPPAPHPQHHPSTILCEFLMSIYLPLHLVGQGLSYLLFNFPNWIELNNFVTILFISHHLHNTNALKIGSSNQVGIIIYLTPPLLSSITPQI